MLLLGLFVSAVEAIGALLIFALIGLTTEADAAIELPVIGDLRRWLPDLPADRLIIAVAAVVAVFFVFRAAAVLAQRYCQARVANAASVDLSTRLLDQYLRMPYAVHLRRNSSELIRNANESVGEILASVLMPGVRLISEGFVVVGILLVLLTTAWVPTLLVALILGPLVFVIMRLIQPRTAELGRVSQREGARSLQALQQALHGYRDITVLGRQAFFLAAYRSSRERVARTRYLRAVLNELPRVSIEAVVVALIAAFLILSTVTGQGTQESFAVLGLFAYAALRIMPALNKVVANINTLRFGRAALDDVEADLTLDPPARDSAARPLPFHSSIRLTAVDFTYDGASTPSLRDIDLEIRRGESLGVVGSTGAGKSTLVDVIVGLSMPTAGTVTIDGVDLRGRETAWHRNIGMVSQDVFLLDDSLRRNIALGIDEAEIDDEQVWAAVRLAQLHEFVEHLPEALETTVGERGVRVSGGQRQRIAIARALYHRPAVLIFDEGTSALDNLTESALIQALAALRQDHTIITVAHRLSTVQDHDRIAFLQDGRVADLGTFAELTHRNAAFRQLARSSPTPL